MKRPRERDSPFLHLYTAKIKRTSQLRLWRLFQLASWSSVEYNGSMHVEIDNRQDKLKIQPRMLRDFATQFASLAKVDLGETTLIIVDDEGCAPINKAAVGHKGATDVITLFYPAIPGDETGSSAEIIVNAECALKQRPEDPVRELAFYIAHAFNHLSGRDDDTPEKRTAMHRRERRWLSTVLKI